MKIKFLFLCVLTSLSFFISYSQNVRSIESISINEVSVIELGANGDSWVGSTYQGIFFYKASDQTWTNFTDANTPGVGNDSITAITTAGIAGSQYAFIGTRNASCYIKDGQCTAFSGLPDTHIAGLTYKEDSLWVLSRSGITTLDSFQHLGTNYGAPFAPITCVQSAGKNCAGFWFGTANFGCYYTTDGVHFDTLNATPQHQNLVDNRVNVVNADNNCGATLVGTKGGFSFCPGDNTPCQNFTTANGLPENDVTAIAQDCKGNTWIGTRDSGLVVFTQPSTFTRITTANGLSDNRITAMSFTPNCTGWIGTKDGHIAVVDTNKAVVQIITVATGISQISAETIGVYVFPQPAVDHVNFVFEKEVKDADLYLTDLSGRNLQHISLNNTTHTTVDVSALPASIYFYQIYNADKQLLKAGKVIR